MPLPHRLPRTEIGRQITPGHPRPVAVDRTLDQRTVRLHRLAHRTLQRREQRLDPSPHLIAEHCRTRHPHSITGQARSTTETRPRRLLVLTAPSMALDADRVVAVAAAFGPSPNR